MSHSGNDALHILTSLNGQLQAVWNRAWDVIRTLYNGESLTLEQCQAISPARYSFEQEALDAHHPKLGSKFEIQLAAPMIDFVCNHTAVLKLNIIEGQYIPIGSNIVVRIPKTIVVFRMGYRMFDDVVDGRRAKTFNLDLPNAQLMKITPSVGKDRGAFEEYLNGYLSLLHSEIHSALYYQGGTQPGPFTDFFRISKTWPCALSVRDVPVESLNFSFCTSWLIASTMPKIQLGKPVDHMRLSLAEKRGETTIGGRGVHFGLVFGAPEIAVACERETRVVVFFDIAEALFYRTTSHESSPFKTFCDWKVAVSMDIMREDGENGNVIKCTLDRRSFHYMKQFSRFPGCLPGDQEAEQCRDRVVEFICGQYLEALEGAGYLTIRHPDSRWVDSQTSALRPSSSTSTSRIAAPIRISWPDVSQQIQMAGYDQVFALTETAINNRINWQWTHPLSSSSDDKFPVEWSHNNVFYATFGPLQVELANERKAILRVPVIKGSLKPTRGRISRTSNIDFFHFSGWVVAFTVDLKHCDHTAKLPGVSSEWLTEFSNSHSSDKDVNFNHIYLDLQHAEFTLRYSTFTDLPIATEKWSIDKAQAAVVYLGDHYLKQLASAGFHVLSSIPVWNAASRSPSRALTSIDFCLDVGTVHSPTPESAILIVGMHNGRPLPSNPPPTWCPWVSNSPTPSHGTLAFSAESFLFASLLPILSEVNAQTRLEPVLNKATHEVSVTSWNKHPRRVMGDCPFSRATEDVVAGPLRYHWKGGRKVPLQRDESSYIRSWTKNSVVFPTNPEPDGLVITLRGSAELEIVERDWSSSASAEWETSIIVSFDNGRPRIKVRPSPTTFTPVVSQGNPPAHLRGCLNPRLQLKEKLPREVEVGGIQQAFEPLQTALEACLAERPGCHIADPVFNCRGDLLLQMMSQETLPDLGVEDESAKITWAVTLHGEEHDSLPLVENATCLASKPNMKPRDTSSYAPAGRPISEVAPHKESASASVQRQLSDGSSSSAGNSPTLDIFSPTGGMAKRRSSHFRAIESGSASDSVQDTPSSSLASSPTSTKCGFGKQDITTYISPEAFDNPVVYPAMPSSRTVRSDPRSIPRVASPLDPPRMDDDLGNEDSWSARGEDPHYAHEFGLSWASNPSLQTTHTRPISTGAALYASGRKDTQTTVPATAITSQYAPYMYAAEETRHGASLSSSYGVPPARTGHVAPGHAPIHPAHPPAPPAMPRTPPAVSTPYTPPHVPTPVPYPASMPPGPSSSSVSPPYVPQPPAYAPRVTSPPVAPPTYATASNVAASRPGVDTQTLPDRVDAPSARPAPTEGPTVSRSPSPQANLPNVDPTIVYPRLPPQSFFTDQTPRPVAEPVLDINTADGRRALRARLAAAAAPPLRGGDFDSLAGSNAIGVELHNDPSRLLPRQTRASPPRELSQAERKRQLEVAAAAINRGRYY